MFGLVPFYLLAFGLGVSSSPPSHVLDNSIVKRQGIPAATWGPFVSMGQTATEYIGLSTTFVAGYPPIKPKGSIFLWPGLFDNANRNQGDLIQSVIELHSVDETRTTCGATAGQWWALHILRFISECCVLTTLAGVFDHSSSITPPDRCRTLPLVAKASTQVTRYS